MLIGKVEEHNNKIYIVLSSRDPDEPILRKSYYPLLYRGGAHQFKRDYGESKIGQDVRYHSIRESYQDDQGLWYLLRDGGRTTPEFTIEEVVKCPKTRKLIETRYRDGHWEKNLTRRGWVPF